MAAPAAWRGAMPRSALANAPVASVPAPSAAALRMASEELIWAIARVLIERGLIEPDEIARKLQHAAESMRSTGPTGRAQDRDRAAASLAIESAIRHLGQ